MSDGLFFRKLYEQQFIKNIIFFNYLFNNKLYNR